MQTLSTDCASSTYNIQIKQEIAYLHKVYFSDEKEENSTTGSLDGRKPDTSGKLPDSKAYHGKR